MAETPLPTTRIAPRRRLATGFTWLWNWLRRPWLAIVAGALGVLVAAAGWLLPQLPGQLVDEQAAAATWLVTTSTTYGIWGNALLALGLFDVLRSPLLYLLLALLVPTLAAHLADQLGTLRQQRSLPATLLPDSDSISGDAVAVPAARLLHRWRGLAAASVAETENLLTATLPAGFRITARGQLPISTTQSTADATADADASAQTDETRLLALRRAHLQYIRPLLMLGMLICVAGAWIALVFGWHITAPPLAPGAVFRSANRGLVMFYTVPLTTTQGAALEAGLQGTRLTLPIDRISQERIGPATIRLRPSFPAVWITTLDGSEQLTLPGQDSVADHIGLVFATPGSEASVLIPEQRAGLRIVQRAGGPGFVLELYRSDTVQPVYRAELTPGGQLTIPLAESAGELRISSLPGLQVDVRHLPGLWLVPLGITLALIGAAAYWRPSGFLVVQIAPWADDQSVVVLQTDHPETIIELQSALAALTPPTSGDDGETILAQPAAAP